jgi:PPOX class probable F420-dependent enzyme
VTGQRDRIRMADEEWRALLEASWHLQVASVGPDGAPHLVPMWFVVGEDGEVLFTTYAKSQKVENLRRDPRITLLVEGGTGYDELHGAMIEGTAVVVSDDPAYTAEVMARVGAKYAGGSGAAPRERAASSEPPPAAYKRAVVRVTPRRVRSWDHRRL